MSADVAGGPPARTPRQRALLTSDAAWGWWTDGYEHGVRDGYTRGHDDATAWLSSEVHQAWTKAFSTSAITRNADAKAKREAGS